MRIVLLILLVLILLGGAGGFVYVGLFPPRPHVHTIDRTLSPDQIGNH